MASILCPFFGLQPSADVAEAKKRLTSTFCFQMKFETQHGQLEGKQRWERVVSIAQWLA